MAQKKIVLELSIVEAQHLSAGVAIAQDAHKASVGRDNPALTRVDTKLDKALSAYRTAQNTKEVPEDAGDGEPAGDDD